MKVKCIIIDDDPFMLDLLMDKLSFFHEVTVAGTAVNGEEGLTLIRNLSPDLVFLDVEMNDMTGFDLLSRLETINFSTIFITSYGHYAIKAIRFNALDYLLKPIDIQELKNAINRYLKKKGSLLEVNHNIVLHNFKTQNPSDQILILKTQEGELKFKLEQIIHIRGDRNYSKIILKDGSEKLVTKTLADMDKLLSHQGFIRSHKSHIFNQKHFIHLGLDSIQLSNGESIKVSRRKRAEIQELTDKINQE